MTTRKQQTLSRKRAHHQPPKHGAARGRQATVRGKAAPGKPAPGKPAPRNAAGSRKHEKGALKLAAECTADQADSLKSQLARRLDESGRVTIDVSALQRIDTAGLQLLAAFVRDRRTAGRAVEWRGRAAALDTAAGLLGLGDMLELAGESGL